MHELLLALVGFFSGMAGPIGGVNSLVSFPCLLLLGMSPLQANVTNTVGGLVPAAIGASLSYRTHIDAPQRTIVGLCVVGALGGIVGGVLLLLLGESVFKAVVPVLLISGSILIVFQPLVVKRLAKASSTKNHFRIVVVGTFLITIYSGYFGAGAGVLLVTLFALMLSGGMQRANAVKSLIALTSNLAAAAYFVFASPVDWSAAAVLAPTSFLGATAGVRIAKRMPDKVLRIVVAVGGVSAALAALY